MSRAVKRFADSNLLCRFVEPAHPDHAAARDLIAEVITRGESLLISPQVEREFWAVATRSVSAPRGGLGMPPQEAQEKLRKMREGFLEFVPDTAAVQEIWRRLVSEHAIVGVRSHDAAMAAAAINAGTNEIVTFNRDDFEKFQKELAVRTPQELLRQFEIERQNAQTKTASQEKSQEIDHDIER